MMVSEPPPSMLRAEPKKRLGRCSALASTPPERILPECGTTVLWARARRVMESSRITTSRLCSTSRLAFSITMSATCTCRSAGSSKVLDTTSPFTVRCMSVTSSGRSSMSSTISTHSGWFSVMALAIFWSRMVFPALGGEVMSARCPFPNGHKQVDDPRLDATVLRLEVELLLRVERGEVVEEDLVLGRLGTLEVHRLDAQQREVAFALLGRTHLPRHRVAGVEIEALDLRRRDVDVVGPGK